VMTTQRRGGKATGERWHGGNVGPR
jgi:hypothetical protein